MAEAREVLLAGLSDRARRLLAEPPATEKRLTELFVITWDPLAARVERPSGFATTNGRSTDLEIVIYLPTW